MNTLITLVTLSNSFLHRDLPVMTLDVVDMHIDVPHHAANIGVGVGDTRVAEVRLRGDIEVEDGAARIHTRLAFGAVGQHVSLALPEIDVQQTTLRDHVDQPVRGFEVVMPLARQSF
jgi:hypothetical protein